MPLYDNDAPMSGLAFWLYVDSDLAITNIVVQRCFETVTNNMCIRDRHRGGNH